MAMTASIGVVSMKSVSARNYEGCNCTTEGTSVAHTFQMEGEGRVEDAEQVVNYKGNQMVVNL